MQPLHHQDSHSETEERLLDAAEKVFAERGFHAATTAAIAASAGVNKTLIHYYFRSKEGLYQAMMDRITHSHEVFLEDLSRDDPVEALVTATRRFVRLLAQNPNYVRLCAYQALEGKESRGLEELAQRLIQVATRAMQRGVDLGVFRAEDPRHVLASVEGMVRFFFEHEDEHREMWGDSWNREQIIEERCDHVVRLLLFGLGVQPQQQFAQEARQGDAPEIRHKGESER